MQNNLFSAVVIVFSLPLDAKRVIQKAHILAPGRFMWIASDGWAGILPEENDEDNGITFDGKLLKSVAWYNIVVFQTFIDRCNRLPTIRKRY